MAPGAPVDPIFLKSLKRKAGTDPHRAYDDAIAALVEHPGDVSLRQIKAGALIQTGSLRAALEILNAIYAEGNRDSETLGLLGSVYKRQAEDAASTDDRYAALAKARDCYVEGLARAEKRGDPEGYYPGINAATVTLLLGDEEVAGTFATRAVALANRVECEDYWVLATKAEAALIQRDVATARALYLSAAETKPGYAQLATTRRQARRIARALALETNIMDDCLCVPPVLIFVGHLTDSPSRQHPRFPEEQAAAVAAKIRAAIEHRGASMGFSSAARGGDVLFIEALAGAQCEYHIVLPLEEDAFRAASVAGGDPGWERRFDQACALAKSKHIANNHSATADGAAFEYGTRILFGLARLQARRLDTELRAIALWDGTAGDGHGGTAWAVGRLIESGVPVENVYPGHEGPVLSAAAIDTSSHEAGRPIRAMLFADCKGYSKLREEQVAEFTVKFLTGVSRLIEKLRPEGCAPAVANTWGDGLFMVFENVRAAGIFASALREGVLRRASELGLPGGVAVRIGLHAGPVTPFQDPVTRRQNFAGQNVAFAARIEPITPENQVCVSEAFAALAAETGLNEFRFEYMGSTPFAKKFGQYPLYQLTTSRDGDTL